MGATVLGAAAGGIVVGGGGGAGTVVDGSVAGGAVMVAGVAGFAGARLAVLALGEPQAVSAAPNASPMTMMMTDARLRTLMMVAFPRWAADGYGTRPAAGFIARARSCVSLGTSSVRFDV
jgi:hypothetical protein